MIIREATKDDIPQMQWVRNSVKENMLSNPALVPDEDVLHYITKRGKGWVSNDGERITGFAIADLEGHSIWALFILPEYEGQGLGKQLHDTMLNWYFSNTHETVWLSTAEHTRAEIFYKKCGWVNVGRKNDIEIKFEMNYIGWQKMQGQ